ncbi:IS3 family transposase [Vibrio mimicus]
MAEKTLPTLTVTTACQFIGGTRQAFYQRRATERKRLELEARVLAFVNKERMRQPRIGTRKLHYLLAQHELCIGRDHLFLLLKAQRLLVPTRRACHRTTNSRHRFYCHPNKLKDGLVPSHPEQLWVADITHFPAHQGEAYISLVTDAYSRKIAGYQVDDTMATRSVKQAFVRALKGRQRETTLVHHSDRGSPYCSSEYQALHQKYGVICSMTDGYDC